MSCTFQAPLRIAGVALVIVAGLLFIVAAARSMQSQEHQRAAGLVIQHRIEIPNTMILVGLAGVVLFAISFIRGRNSR
jgi:TRAP-type C4-dicarboxylate transport system permease small subunit